MTKRTTQSVYNAKEWAKIEKLASEKGGKAYTSAQAAKKHLTEYEDARIAKDRFNDPKSKIISSREIRKIKLTKEERAIEKSLDEYVPVRGRELARIKADLQAFTERRKEPSIPYKQLLKKLKKSRKI